MTTRDAAVKALRLLADRIEADPEFPTPYKVDSLNCSSRPTIYWFPGGSADKATAAAAEIRRQIGGTWAKTVPDPEALASVPMVEVTREVETFEWDCAPILATTAVTE